MRRYSAGQQWEDLNRKRQEAEHQEREAQKAAAAQALKAQIEGFPSLTSVDASLPVIGSARFRDSKSRYYRRQDEVLELEAQGPPPPQYRPHEPLTPPASNGEASGFDQGEQIRRLQKAVVQKEGEIKRLEAEIDGAKDEKRRLQAERHEAVDAQRRADDELRKLRRKVANLDQLLDGSIRREKELESELDVARQEVAALKRRLHEELCDYEDNVRAQGTRERHLGQQLEETKSKLENEMGRDRHPDRDVRSVGADETHGKTRPLREAAAPEGNN